MTKISGADEMIKVYCRVTTLEPTAQYSECLKIHSKTTLELITQQDSRAEEIFGKRDKLLNSPNISKDFFSKKPEIVKTSEKFIFDQIFKESMSFEEVWNHLSLNPENHHCLVSLRPSDLFSSKNGLIFLAIRWGLDRGYSLKVAMAKVNLQGISTSLFKGYRILESCIDGLRFLMQIEYFTEQRTKDDSYVTTLVFMKNSRHSKIQFADIPQLSKNTDMLAKILTDSEYSKNASNPQAGNQLIQILCKSICFGGNVYVFGHIQGISPYLALNRQILYYIDHLYKNRGKPRNAYSELLIGEIIKLQKSNSRLREKVQSSTQVLLTQEEVKDQKKFMNRPLEIIEEKEEGFEHQEDHLGRTKCTKECNEMFEKIQEQNKELESQLKELKNEISALKNMEKNQYSELNNFKMKNKELNDELLILKGCNPESTVKIAEENSKIHEKLSKITEENLKLTEKFSKTTKENSELKEALVKISGDLKNNEECLKSLEKQSKRDEETLLSHKKTLSGENSISKSGFEQENPDINAIHKHYYELITAEAHAIKSYEDLMNFRLEELHDLYSSTVDKYNQDIHQKIHLKIETLQNEIKTLKGKLMETSHEIQEKNKDLELKKSEIQAKNNELFSKNQEINGKTQELDNLNLKMNEAQKHFEFEKSHELKRRFTKALEKEKSIFKSELDEKSSIIKQLEQKVFYLNSQITELKEKINKTEDELAKVQVNFTELKGKYAMLKKMATSH